MDLSLWVVKLDWKSADREFCRYDFYKLRFNMYTAIDVKKRRISRWRQIKRRIWMRQHLALLCVKQKIRE